MSLKPLKVPGPGEALPGRSNPVPVPARHFVLDAPLETLPEGAEQALFGMGCFWGAERKFWQTPGVISSAVGYAGGQTPNPSYEEVCSGKTGHSEVVRVVYEPHKVTYSALLKLFWENHDPTQGMRQGNDVGTQYRSVLYYFTEAQKHEALESRRVYQEALSKESRGAITTEILPAPPFFFAEEYHQQYLAKNPNGYCGIGGTGVGCPVSWTAQT